MIKRRDFMHCEGGTWSAGLHLIRQQTKGLLMNASAPILAASIRGASEFIDAQHPGQILPLGGKKG